MKNSIYDTGTEATLIEKFNSYSSPCEESNALLAYLWEKNLPFITGQCRQYFATSSYINYEDTHLLSIPSNMYNPNSLPLLFNINIVI